jgi:hypothetical protein
MPPADSSTPTKPSFADKRVPKLELGHEEHSQATNCEGSAASARLRKYQRPILALRALADCARPSTQRRNPASVRASAMDRPLCCPKAMRDGYHSSAAYAASCSHVTSPRCSAIGRSTVAKRSATVPTSPSAVCAPRSGRR